MISDYELIKKLREKTGASLLDCQKVLAETRNDIKKALEILRKKGQKIVAAKIDRLTKAGVIGFYLHSNEKIAALVELSCETDFVARNQEFKELAHDLAMQVAAMNPLYLKPEDIPKEVLKKEEIIEGKLEKFYEITCLLKQSFIKDQNIKVEDLLKSKIAKLRENIQIRRFVRFEI